MIWLTPDAGAFPNGIVVHVPDGGAARCPVPASEEERALTTELMENIPAVHDIGF